MGDFIFNLSPLQLNQSLFSAVGSASAARTLQIAALGRNEGARSPQENADQARLAAQARAAERTIEGFSKLRIKQQRAVNIIEKATERLDDMKALLLEARELIVLAQEPTATAEGQRDLANLFDQLLGQYNLKAKGASFSGVNLIGASIRDIFEPNDLEVQTKPGSLVNTVYKGNFVGSDYEITDLSGNTFLPNLFGSSVVQFPNADPNDTGILLQDDDVVSFDSTTGALSITRNGGSSPVLEGTLERKGVGVLSSYFYGNFQDPALLDEALSDITDALSSVRFNIAIFGTQLRRAEVAVEVSDARIDESRSIVARQEAEAFEIERRFTLEEQKRQLIFEQAINNTLSYNSQGLPALTQAAFFGFET